ncbi:MAG: hypothetical protein VX872_05430, partial [Candidatus Thermoplasmatota archaeon]|nr:hypothetical protein [Candidatus Thermoplasmatota archaeon]
VPPFQGDSELPLLQVVAPRQEVMVGEWNWTAQVCTNYSAASNDHRYCSEAETWKSDKKHGVNLCIDGKFFSWAAMHTRGHVSALLPKLKCISLFMFLMSYLSRGDVCILMSEKKNRTTYTFTL